VCHVSLLSSYRSWRGHIHLPRILPLVGCRSKPPTSGSRPESTHGVCGGSPQNCMVTWLSHKTKTEGSEGGDGIRARREALMPADTWRDRRACVRRTQTAAMAWPCDGVLHDLFALSGLYLNLSARGSLVICPTQRDSYILTPAFLGKPSFWTASHFLAP
jgi:hypothetical protein